MDEYVGEDGLCRLTELVPEFCGCRHHRGGLAPGETYGRTFLAHYDGRCEACEEPVRRGQQIMRVEGDHGFVHVECA